MTIFKRSNQTNFRNEKKNRLYLYNDFISKGVRVFMYHQNTKYQLIVSDEVLGENIGEETYNQFYSSVIRNSKIKPNTFTLKKKIKIKDYDDILHSLERFEEIKIINAYFILLLFYSQNDINLQNIKSSSPIEYIQSVLKTIKSDHNDELIKKFSDILLHSMKSNKKYFNGNPQIKQYGVEVPNLLQTKSRRNGILDLVMIIIILILLSMIYYTVK
jgi:hypothetical protein